VSDIISKIGSSTIHHGPGSNRLYLMKLAPQDSTIIPKLEEIALTNGYTKIIAKVPQTMEETFSTQGYQKEAHIPYYYYGQEHAVFMARYLSPQRSQLLNKDIIQKALTLAQGKPLEQHSTIDKGIEIYQAKPEDATKIAQVYGQVFSAYPFPIINPDYVKKTMASNVQYYYILDKNQIVSLASAEIDSDYQNAEMTDFGTLPPFRSKGYAIALLRHMENEMKMQGIKTLYTIARAVSLGINCIFAKRGFKYSGTLINNTGMPEGLESMNVWHKQTS